MPNVVSAIKNTVSVTQFNRGMAGKIFASVKNGDVKVVMKNNSPECVLISPDEYVSMIEEIEEARMLALALERVKSTDMKDIISRDDIMKKYGITENMLDGIGDVEFE